LLLIFARSHDPGQAESLLCEVERAVQEASGWHAWKWRLRLSQARAELALARGNLTDAIIYAGNVVEQSRSRSRPKYEALGLAARARARGQLGMRQAVEDARMAVDVACRLADPAVLFECLAVLLELDGNDNLLVQAQQTVQNILGELSQESLRRTFMTIVSAKIGATLQS